MFLLWNSLLYFYFSLVLDRKAPTAADKLPSPSGFSCTKQHPKGMKNTVSDPKYIQD